jgi:Amt family ammonium transporter
VLVVIAALFVETRFRIDDPVGAIAVHGANGTWGVIALGLFANGSYGHGLNGVPGPVRGLFHGDAGQLVASLIAIVASMVYVGSVSALTFFVMGKVVGNRVAEADELEGLDLPEMGIEGYSPEYQQTAAQFEYR